MENKDQWAPSARKSRICDQCGADGVDTAISASPYFCDDCVQDEIDAINEGRRAEQEKAAQEWEQEQQGQAEADCRYGPEGPEW